MDVGVGEGDVAVDGEDVVVVDALLDVCEQRQLRDELALEAAVKVALGAHHLLRIRVRVRVTIANMVIRVGLPCW